MCYDVNVLRRFKLKFRFKGESWIECCISRLSDIIETEHSNVWFVKGRVEFGDCHPLYKVIFLNNFNQYVCTCYSIDRPYGIVRMKNICTHVGSVILWRMLRGDSIEKYGFT